jgi:hypothetical protein
MGHIAQIWHMKQDAKTPAYTTDWTDLLTVQMDGGGPPAQWP